eukprot:GSChrysophyteH1.ASY1.ANO1.665.1 assembled CDS
MSKEQSSAGDNKASEKSDIVVQSSSQAGAGGAQSDDSNNARAVRDPRTRPVYKLSVELIDTYKYINKVYYEARAKKSQDAAASRGGTHNEGYDDQHYDYILHTDEVFANRYVLKQRIGKGSFGQVSRRPFMLQAQTEIELLSNILEKDREDENNVMLSYNLYELLKNTRFKGVSLNLIRKFSKQILKSLQFLAKPEVDIIHCDLKPENILLQNPRRSAIKLIDFGSSCYSSKRTYTYIQSRFYRSPEILLGLKYTQKIDIWSLGCVLVEMHSGEPLFGGADQMDQMCRIVAVLGMPPYSMIAKSPDSNRQIFFEKRYSPDNSHFYILKRSSRDAPSPRTLDEIVGLNTGGPFGRRKGEQGHTRENYMEFVQFISKLLIFDPDERSSAAAAMRDPYILDVVNGGQPSSSHTAKHTSDTTPSGGGSSSTEETSSMEVDAGAHAASTGSDSIAQSKISPLGGSSTGSESKADSKSQPHESKASDSK